jgi:hypothetical protein
VPISGSGGEETLDLRAIEESSTLWRVGDRLRVVRTFRTLNVVDDFTREASRSRSVARSPAPAWCGCSSA